MVNEVWFTNLATMFRLDVLTVIRERKNTCIKNKLANDYLSRYLLPDPRGDSEHQLPPPLFFLFMGGLSKQIYWKSVGGKKASNKIPPLLSKNIGKNRENEEKKGKEGENLWNMGKIGGKKLGYYQACWSDVDHNIFHTSFFSVILVHSCSLVPLNVLIPNRIKYAYNNPELLVV